MAQGMRLASHREGFLMFDRRDFLKSTAAASAASLTAGFTATSHGCHANESINVACIGTGGRCRKLMESLAKIPGVKIAAVCDVWDIHLDMAHKLADAQAV